MERYLEQPNHSVHFWGILPWIFRSNVLVTLRPWRPWVVSEFSDFVAASYYTLSTLLHYTYYARIFFKLNSLLKSKPQASQNASNTFKWKLNIEWLKLSELFILHIAVALKRPTYTTNYRILEPKRNNLAQYSVNYRYMELCPSSCFQGHKTN